VFDLASVHSLEALREAALSAESQAHIQSSIDLRVRENHHFVIPSRISTILSRLKPGCQDQRNLVQQPKMDHKPTNAARSYAKIVQKAKRKFVIKKQLSDEQEQLDAVKNGREKENKAGDDRNVTKIDVAPEIVPVTIKSKLLGQKLHFDKPTTETENPIFDSVTKNETDDKLTNGSHVSNEKMIIDLENKAEKSIGVDETDKVSTKSKTSLKKYVLKPKKMIQAYFHTNRKTMPSYK